VGGILYSKDGTELVRYPSTLPGDYTFPDEVDSVWAYAFQDAEGLVDIVIPSKLIEINNRVFSGCIGLSSVTFETSWNPILEQWRGVGTIGIYAFQGCTSLESITLPRTLSDISMDAFYGCEALESIAVDSNNPVYAGVDGILYNKALSNLLLCPVGKTTADLIPASVTAIRDFGFENCTSLSSVRLSAALTSIGDKAFIWCSSLTSVRIPSAVTHIGDEAFRFCTSLTNAHFSGSVAPAFFGIGVFSNASPDFRITFRLGSSGYSAPYWYGCPSVAVLNLAPVLAGIGNRTIQPGQTITFTISATDVNKDDLVYSAVGNGPQPAK